MTFSWSFPEFTQTESDVTLWLPSQKWQAGDTLRGTLRGNGAADCSLVVHGTWRLDLPKRRRGVIWQSPPARCDPATGAFAVDLPCDLVPTVRRSETVHFSYALICRRHPLEPSLSSTTISTTTISSSSSSPSLHSTDLIIDNPASPAAALRAGRGRARPARDAGG